jgi:hypothetical protein
MSKLATFMNAARYTGIYVTSNISAKSFRQLINRPGEASWDTEPSNKVMQSFSISTILRIEMFQRPF